jgi:hypothetical protein
MGSSNPRGVLVSKRYASEDISFIPQARASLKASQDLDLPRLQVGDSQMLIPGSKYQIIPGWLGVLATRVPAGVCKLQ